MIIKKIPSLKWNAVSFFYEQRLLQNQMNSNRQKCEIIFTFFLQSFFYYVVRLRQKIKLVSGSIYHLGV